MPGFGLIPVGVAGEGFQVGGGVEQKERTWSGCSKVTWRADGMFLRLRTASCQHVHTVRAETISELSLCLVS